MLPANQTASDQGADRPATFLFPMGGTRLFYRNPATGERHWERMVAWQMFVLGMVLLNLIGSLLTNSLGRHGGNLFLIGYAVLLGTIFLSIKKMKNKITMTRDGFIKQLTLPFLPDFLLYHKKHRWSDLECVRYQKAESLSSLIAARYGRCDSLVFDWRGRKNTYSSMLANTTYLNLWVLDDGQREQFFAALSRFVPQEVLAPEVLYMQVQTLSGASTKDLDNCTQVWLEEYNRKFEISNYVTLPPGTRCGNDRLTIYMTIAARVNSSTYLAATADGGKVIVKELVAPIDSDDEMQKKLLEQFNREAAILAKLDHPAIVKVIDHFIENGRSYIVMEQAPGKNIREYVRQQGALPEARVRDIGAQLASVLHYLHHHSPAILHRDFTPDNIMLAEDGTVTVVDFGAANVYNTGKTATLIGKQSYMPPEQLRGKPSPESDIYAFGATLSFLLTGKDLPSMGKLPAFDEVQVSSELKELIQKCTAFDSADRPDSDAVLHTLKMNKPTPVVSA
ncbi:MAG: serine/threonine protein kinase [Cyanobacteria bacterium SZAS TMP-1]|nr:serine/threonine protein kinase [Cyanobacteria bacterium SZAS TMP-1]